MVVSHAQEYRKNRFVGVGDIFKHKNKKRGYILLKGLC